MKKRKLEMTDEFLQMMEATSDPATVSFIQNFVKDLANKVKSRNISSHLGLQHPSGQPSGRVHPFRPIQDGFGNTLRRPRDLIERMNARRITSISNQTPMFPQMPGNRKRRSWNDDLDRAEERDNTEFGSTQ
jgi:hypothetical protein